MRLRILIILGILAPMCLNACSFLSEEQIAATDTAATATASSPTPTITHSPTASDTPTLTQTPSETPTPTETPTETLTPTLTYTPTDPASPTPTLTLPPTETLIPPTITPCPSDLTIRIDNRTGSNVTITLFGPCIYILNLAPGQNTFMVLAGYYDYSIFMCNASHTGSFTFSAGGRYYIDC